MIGIMSNRFVERFLAATRHRQTLDRGSVLFHREDPVRFVFVVVDGLVALTRPQADGTGITLQRAGPNSVLAEASVYSRAYHCDGVAEAPSQVAAMPLRRFLEQLSKDRAFADAWAESLAGEVQRARYRAEILTRRTVAERLDGWLAWPGNALPDRGDWKDLAAQLGVSPEALYRELAKRRPG